MKKIFTLAVIFISIASFANAQPRPGNMTIHSNSNAFIQVVVDGRQYNMDRNNFVMDYIRPGRHCVEVYAMDNCGTFRRGTQRIYASTMDIRPWESLNVNIDRFLQVCVDARPMRDDRYNGDYGYGYGRNDRYNNYNNYDRGQVYGDRGDYYRH